MESVRSADLAFKSFECGTLIRGGGGPAFRYTEYDIWNFDPQHTFAEAAQNHSSIFTSKFLEVFQKDGYEAAIAAAREDLMNMPVTASTSEVSFKDLNVIVNAAKQDGFKNLDDLNNSDMSDLMKKHLESEWRFLQHSLA
jgi:hypothetical protein